MFYTYKNCWFFSLPHSRAAYFENISLCFPHSIWSESKIHHILKICWNDIYFKLLDNVDSTINCVPVEKKNIWIVYLNKIYSIENLETILVLWNWVPANGLCSVRESKFIEWKTMWNKNQNINIIFLFFSTASELSIFCAIKSGFGTWSRSFRQMSSIHFVIGA